MQAENCSATTVARRACCNNRLDVRMPADPLRTSNPLARSLVLTRVSAILPTSSKRSANRMSEIVHVPAVHVVKDDYIKNPGTCAGIEVVVAVTAD